MTFRRSGAGVTGYFLSWLYASMSPSTLGPPVSRRSGRQFATVVKAVRSG